MRVASESIRRLCLVSMLALVPVATAMSATVPSTLKHASARQHHHTSNAKRLRSHPAAHRAQLHSLSPRRSYVLASIRIPFRTFSAITDASALASIPDDSVQTQNERRLPRQVPRKTAALQGVVTDSAGRGIIGAMIALTNRATGMTRTVSTDADGVFRWTDLAPGNYLLLAQDDGFESLTRDNVQLDAGDEVTLELTLAASEMNTMAASRLPRLLELGAPPPAAAATSSLAPYRELRRRPDAERGQEIPSPENLPPSKEVFLETPDRWNVVMPKWNRYGRGGDFPYVRASHWWDPFNRNRLKGDSPIWGQQTFLNITATSDTFADERRVPDDSPRSNARLVREKLLRNRAAAASFTPLADVRSQHLGRQLQAADEEG